MNTAALTQRLAVQRHPVLIRRHLIQSNLDVVLRQAPDLTARFYGTLCRQHPEAMMLFGRRSAETQARLLLDAVMTLVGHVPDLAWLDMTLRALGRKHAAYGVTEEMYPFVASALLDTVRDASGECWDERTANAWSNALSFVASRMMSGARERAVQRTMAA